MAGTNHRRTAVTGGPAIILVEPQLGENIGTAARAMLNCGLDDLRLVRPRDGWPSDKAIAAASGASISHACRAPAVIAASVIACRCWLVAAAGTHIMTSGRNSRWRPCARATS